MSVKGQRRRKLHKAARSLPAYMRDFAAQKPRNMKFRPVPGTFGPASEVTKIDPKEYDPNGDT